MKRVLMFGFVLMLLPLATRSAGAQMPPKENHSGESLSIVLNDSANAMTIEVHNNGEWQQLKIEARKDATVTGDRVRVATPRDDKAIITVDFPVQAGKKYRLAWNSRATMWDFSLTQ